MTKILLGHSAADLNYAEALALALQEAGHETTLVISDAAASKEASNILSTTVRSFEAYLPILSNSNINSDGAMMEIARSMGYASATDRFTVIPLLLDKIEPPSLLNATVYVRASRNPGEALPAIMKLVAAFEGRMQSDQARKLSVEADLSEFVQEAITQQEKYETANKSAAVRWYVSGVVFLGIGLLVTAGLVVSTIWSAQDLNIVRALATVALDLVSIGILAALAKYAYSLGKSYMTEGLKCSDRIHAIQFGKFYLKVFGARLTPTEVKDAFQHWNIDRSSAFASLDASQIDPQILSLVGQLVTSIRNKKD